MRARALEDSESDFRDRHLHVGYTLRGHLVRTLSVAAAVLTAGVWLSSAGSWMHWLALPVFWVIANLFEWATHRFPMHRPMFPRMMYRNHALVHHRAFAGDHAQEIRSTTDLCLVMMPWYTILLVFSMASPVALVASVLGGPALAGVFLVAAISYFLLYETIHTLHHLQGAQLERLGAARWRWLTALRRHHHFHHRPGEMAHTNFNVTAPLADRLFGTYFKQH
ncbi:MAG: sterol desaturase family protein [Nannocystaceae bacterium]|nr:sterol desaturase family protein [Nannocystaceae bacterium]